MKTLNLCVIGAGSIYWNCHQKNISRMDGVNITALCDPSPESRKRAEKELGAAAFESVEEWLETGPEVDAVLNFSPPFIRKKALEAAIQLNVPLFVEKPVAGSSKEAEELLALLSEHPVPVSVGFMFRYMLAVEKFEELLKGKTIVDVHSEFVCPAITKWGMADWFLKKEISGGPILDQAIHLFDLSRYLLGDVTEVASFETNVVKAKGEDCTIEDTSVSLLRFANGAVGTHNQTWVHDETVGFVRIRTVEDDLSIDLMNGSLTGTVGGKAYHFEPSEGQKEFNDHYRELDTFLNGVRTGDFSAVKSSVADAAASLTVSERVNQAMEAGTPLSLDGGAA